MPSRILPPDQRRWNERRDANHPRLPGERLSSAVSRPAALIDRALYLPKAWTDDPARLAVAHVPPEIGFATKPRLAVAMVERAIAADVPFRWVTADSITASVRWR